MLLAVSWTVGCSPGPPIVRSSFTDVAVQGTELPMTVLVPSIEFVDVQTDAILPRTVSADTDSLANFIVQVACEVLDRSSLVCAGKQSNVAPGRDEELRNFVAEAKHIVGAPSTTGWSDLLLAVAAGDSTRCVVVHHVRAKIGPGGYWNPNSGAIASSLRTTHLRVAVVECGSGRILRRSEAFVRMQPDPRRAAFVSALRAAYERIR